MRAERPCLQLLDKNRRVRPLADLKKEIFLRVIDHFGGNLSDAAGALGIGRSTLYRIRRNKLPKRRRS
jgi:transcriptional regulator of acetoin/glycerol metabolism